MSLIFDNLIRRHQVPVSRYVGGFGVTRQDTQELVQETFLAAYRNLHQYDERKGSAATWLYTIARNLTLNHLGSSYVRASHRHDEVSEEIETKDPSGLQTLEQEERRKAVYAALQKVSEPFREAIVLSALEELTLEEAALIAQCPVGTMKSRIARGKNQMRAILSERFGGEHA